MKKLIFTFVLLLSAMTFQNFTWMEKPKLYKKLTAYCATLSTEFEQISEERKAALQELGDYIYEKQKAGKLAELVVICTHNSRRSHIGQLWLSAAAVWYGLDHVETFSGGTEATAFNPRAVAAMKRAGFKIEKLNATKNPVYQVTYGSKYPKRALFSKKYDDSLNPHKEFLALMVCSEADASCPIVPGAEERLAIPYEDPKHYDNTPSETLKYDERCRQIAREMFFAMNHAKQKAVLEAEQTSSKN